MAGATSSGRLPAQLDRWVAQQLISREQADRILAAEGSRAGTSLVGEALGYVGGVLVLVAAAIITGRYWVDLGVGGRLAVAFGSAVVLFTAGTALGGPVGGARRRLRSACWLLSVATVGLAVGLLAHDVLHLAGQDVLLLVGVCAGVCAGALWWWHREVPQQAALVAALSLAVGAGANHLPHSHEAVVGLAIWAVGVVWLLLGWRGWVTPRSAVWVIGGVPTVLGAQLTTATDWGAALAVATAVALVVAGVAVRDLVLLGVGAVAALLAVPAALDRYFPETLTAPLALLVTGVVLVAAAVQVTRHHPRGPRRG